MSARACINCGTRETPEVPAPISCVHVRGTTSALLCLFCARAHVRARLHDGCTRLLRVPLLPILRAHACLAALTALRLPRMRRAQARPRPAAQRRCVHASVVLCAALPELSVLRAVARHCGVPVLQCMRDVQEAARRAGSAAGHRCRICTGTVLTAATSAPGRGSPLPHLHRDCGSPLPHLHRDCAHPCHVCIGTGLTPTTSAPRSIDS